ncbi:MAG TPA: DNA mismatch repair endonuclease MutL [Ruminococcaceae bacterium]|nr:DNA mismatch repair endonuclease MutL [Oscillospiraceae bacterium]
MPKIHVLPRDVYERISAGEVVERPSSAVKELLENSVDAGATSVTLEIQNGGVKYIRITDNGCGIARSDVKNAFISHATSKIEFSDDLDSIATLGFRGEALASIAAVSRVEMLTRTAEEAVGTRCCVEGGVVTEFDDAGCPLGTTIVVRDLFYNVPARMKFLKKDVTEANSVAAVAERLAVSHPKISVRFIRDGKQTLFAPGDGKLLSALHAVYGADFANRLIPVSGKSGNVSVEGYICKPSAARPNRNMELFYVNNRVVRTKTGYAAVEEVYKGSIMVGKFPSCVLNLKMPYSFVDVNVHPAKTEVRFASEKEVFGAVYNAVKTALNQAESKAVPFDRRPVNNAVMKDFFANIPAKQFRMQETEAQPTVSPKKAEKSVLSNSVGLSQPAFSPKSASRTDSGFSLDLVVEDDAVAPYRTEKEADEPSVIPSVLPNAERKTEEPTVEVPAEEKTVTFTTEQRQEVFYIGEAFKTYLLAQCGKELLLIDKHAAHERVLYEQLKKQHKDQPSQLLMIPLTVKLSRNEYEAVLEHASLLSEAGFTVEDFGDGTVSVSEYPVLLQGSDIVEQVTEIAGYLANHSREITTQKLDWIYHSAACRAAVKAGDFTDWNEAKAFVERILAMPDIRYCPHGRPVIAKLTQREIEKLFGRV